MTNKSTSSTPGRARRAAAGRKPGASTEAPQASAAQKQDDGRALGRLQPRRSLATEVGIVVAGVLLALATEQAAQWLRTQHEVSEARDALRDEVSRDAGVIAYTVQEDRCLLASLDLLAASARGGSPPPAMPPPALMVLSSTVWDVSRNGAVADMPLKERLAFARFYQGVATQNAIIEREIDIASSIVALSSLEAPTSEQRQRLLEEINRSRPTLRYKIANAPGLLATATALGVKPKPAGPRRQEQLRRVCEAAGVGH